MSVNFDQPVDRRSTNSLKWQKYPEDVLPLWVADMDFAAPEPILAALQRFVAQGALGYENPSRELCETVSARMQTLYNWKVEADWVIATPGVVAGFTIAAQTVCTQGQGILVQPPVYPPFLKVHQNAGLVLQQAPLTYEKDGSTLNYSIDFDIFKHAFGSSVAPTGMFLLCNPHNPTGKVYARDDLLHMARLCLENDTVLCSDEIHSELLLGGSHHTPIAALDPEIGDRTITLIAPSKTFNVPGLFCGFAIIANPELRSNFKQMLDCNAMHVASPGLAAAQAAYSGECDDWLAALQGYLTSNRDFVVSFVQKELSDIGTTVPEATYLAWLDCSGLIESGKIDGTPHEFFLKNAKVALNEGRDFGPGGEGFTRLNFGCQRTTLSEALERIKASLGV